MVIPVEQICPVCGDHFMGSDVVGLPCMACQGFSILDDEVLTESLGDAIYGPFRNKMEGEEGDVEGNSEDIQDQDRVRPDLGGVGSGSGAGGRGA